MNRMYLMSHRGLNFTEGSIRATSGGEENGDRLFVTQPTVESRTVENEYHRLINQSIYLHKYFHRNAKMQRSRGEQDSNELALTAADLYYALTTYI